MRKRNEKRRLLVAGACLCVALTLLSGCAGLINAPQPDCPVFVRSISLKMPDAESHEFSDKYKDLIKNMEKSTIEDFMWEDFIWRRFIDEYENLNNEYEEALTVTRANWKKRRDVYTLRLVNEARVSGLDYESLEKTLKQRAEKHKTEEHKAEKLNYAYLPLVATYVEDPETGKKYCAVFAVWGVCDKRHPISHLGHVEAWLTDIETMEVVGNSSCL
ncbi:MAG: hypothetical protein FWG05_03040 [Kiritimatiellaeota bacterium]|nr:hypothetical protein [Kiritimatiellota bacterium]